MWLPRWGGDQKRLDDVALTTGVVVRALTWTNVAAYNQHLGEDGKRRFEQAVNDWHMTADREHKGQPFMYGLFSGAFR